MLGVEGEVPFSVFVAADDGIPICEVLSAEDFAMQEQLAGSEDTPEDDEGDSEEPRRPVSQAEALEAVDTVRFNLCQRQDLPEEILEMPSKIESLVSTAPMTKQTTILDYFGKKSVTSHNFQNYTKSN